MSRRYSGWIILSIFMVVTSSVTADRPPTTQTKKAEPVDIAAYIPLDNGRTWTYQWIVQFKGGRKETTSRTKSFEGPEFLATGYAYKFMSDLGDYVLLSVDDGKLRMHGTVEPHRNIRFVFDPPVVLYSPVMEFGQRYTITQPNEDGNGQREWTTIVNGFEDVETPMGQFKRCLKVHLEMKSTEARTKSVYYYAQGLGLVAYRYQAWSGMEEQSDVAIDARLKLGQLAGRSFTRAAELEEMAASMRAASPRVDEPDARKEFKHSYEQLYFWPAAFPGFQADFTLRRGLDTPGSTPAAHGVITVTSDLKIKVSGVDKRTAQQIETEMSQFITHLKNRPFVDQYKDAVITFGDKNPEQGVEIEVSAENTMGTSYRIKEGQIHQIGHSYGRVRFLVNHTNFMKTDDGRLIPSSFRIRYYSNETNQLIDQIDFQDDYLKVGDIWLPAKRVKTETVKDQTSTLEVEFAGHQLLK